MQYKSLNQLVCAALINHRFCDSLLKDPARAIQSGFHGQDFSLSKEEHELLLSIQANGLEDFAIQVYDWIFSRNRAPEGHDSPAQPSAVGVIQEEVSRNSFRLEPATL